MADASDEEENASANPTRAEVSEEEEEEDDEDEDDGAADPDTAGSNGAKNSNLVVGHNNDRAFVVRGNKIGVFSTGGDKIQYSTTIKNMKTKGGKSFVPEHVRALALVFTDLTVDLKRSSH